MRTLKFTGNLLEISAKQFNQGFFIHEGGNIFSHYPYVAVRKTEKGTYIIREQSTINSEDEANEPAEGRGE